MREADLLKQANVSDPRQTRLPANKQPEAARRLMKDRQTPPLDFHSAREVCPMTRYKKILIGLLVLAALVAGWILLQWKVVIIN